MIALVKIIIQHVTDINSNTFLFSATSSKASTRKRRHDSSPASSISSTPTVDDKIDEERKKAEEKANAELDALVEEFLDEEKRMVDKLDDEKRRYLAVPEHHRDYTVEWNYFYKQR